MADREIKIGLASYVAADSLTLPDGRVEARWAFGLYGEVVDVHDSDLDRFDRLNSHAKAEVVPLPEVPPENDIAAQEPPRSGKGSGVDVWSEYAEKLGLLVPDDASRDDIIALVDDSK